MCSIARALRSVRPVVPCVCVAFWLEPASAFFAPAITRRILLRSATSRSRPLHRRPLSLHLGLGRHVRAFAIIVLRHGFAHHQGNGRFIFVLRSRPSAHCIQGRMEGCTRRPEQ